jgi:hypothetical protein
MSRKHFISFAKIANQYSKIAGYRDKAMAIYEAVCEVNDNPNFNRAKFKTACGLD